MTYTSPSVNSYLCMREGKRLEADQFYGRVVAKNRELFHCAWGSRDYRQAAIAMARHFISPDATFAALDDALAEAADHSTDVDHAHYGRAFGDHPRLTHSDLERQRWICQEWHSFLGLGPFPVQEPLSGLRTFRTSTIDKEAIKSALSDMIPELSGLIASAVMEKLGLQQPLPGTSQAEETGQAAATPHRTIASQLPRPVAIIEPLVDIDVEMDTGLDLDWDFDLDADLQPPQSPPAFHPAASPGIHSMQANKGMAAETAAGSSPRRSVSHKRAAAYPKHPPATALLPSSSQPIVAAGTRKRRAPEPVDSDLEVEEVTVSQKKRVCRSAGALSRELFRSSDDDCEDSCVDQDSLPDRVASPMPDESTLNRELSIRHAITGIVGNPSAREKSRERMNSILVIMKPDPRDMVVVVMKTGGGKSLLWTVPPLLGIEGILVVISPFKSLLEEQYRRCMKAGIRCHHYSDDKRVPESVQNLFLQIEHVTIDVFLR